MQTVAINDLVTWAFVSLSVTRLRCANTAEWIGVPFRMETFRYQLLVD